MRRLQISLEPEQRCEQIEDREKEHWFETVAYRLQQPNERKDMKHPKGFGPLTATPLEGNTIQIKMDDNWVKAKVINYIDYLQSLVGQPEPRGHGQSFVDVIREHQEEDGMHSSIIAYELDDGVQDSLIAGGSPTVGYTVSKTMRTPFNSRILEETNEV